MFSNPIITEKHNMLVGNNSVKKHRTLIETKPLIEIKSIKDYIPPSSDDYANQSSDKR